MDGNGDINVMVLIALVLVGVYRMRRRPVPQHNSVLTGDLYYREIMGSANVNRFRQVARMDKDTFNLLKANLIEGGLTNSMYICCGQKLMILLHVLRGHTNRETAERWQHSGATISEIVHEVSYYLDVIKGRIYKPARDGDPTPAQIANSRRFSPFFDNCIGAIDGTHIPAIIPVHLQFPFRNRKKVITQNVLAVANFDLTYSYALFGWEGSAHDARVYDDAKVKGLPRILGKFYLGDGGYGLSRYLLTPYRGVRYHIIEFAGNGLAPANKKELFNHRHSSLRICVERLFGVTKNRFPVLRKMSPYSFEFQCDIVQCCFLLHNFIRLNQLYEDEFYDLDIEINPHLPDDDENEDDDEEGGGANMQALKAWRNDIADAMWAQYQLDIAVHYGH
jgi:DDE superfamily endonuclease